MKFTFKNREDYLTQRNALWNKANDLLNEGKIKECDETQADITLMDDEYEQYAQKMANLNALKDNAKVFDFKNAGVGVNPVATAGKFGSVADDPEDLTNSIEYRKAFMNYVQFNKAIPAQFNANENTKTTDVGAVIPATVLNKIIEAVENNGMILSRVTRTAYASGLAIPTSNVKPVATWVAEGAGSDKKKKTTGTITFSHFKLRCAVSMSLEVSVMTLSAFETALIKNVSEAMVKALETAIISGAGTASPKGILTETAPTGQALTYADLSYKTLIEAEAAIPVEKENNAVWAMTKKTFMAFMGMTDQSGQPIARINYGLGGKPERTLLGRRVVINPYMDTFSTTLAANKIFAFIFDFSDYILNTNYNMTMKRYEDNETEDQITKAIMVADGKVVDKTSLVTLAKKASS